MPLVCRQCSRVNPAEAYYCYFDGAALAGRAASDGPINLGAQPFPSPFVFPSGVNCRNFDQLAMACQQNWKEAVSVLKEGYLGSFFGSIGRADLARAAKEGAAFPGPNRGLDQLLGKLPSQTLESPKLRVEPTEINLGQLRIGTDRTLDLALENQGQRLVYGVVTSDCPWLTLAGHSTKQFELTEEMTIPIQIIGKSLRARLKPQEGHLIVESNAGNFIITLRIEVPPLPFPEGSLTGALSPRQIAEKAKANPNAAVPMFEGGAVARWFAANGLAYPVQGPTAPGVAGVQQFFEALGLAKPPKVEFTPRPIHVEGSAGETFEYSLVVATQDKKLVYAYATADQPWIDSGAAKPNGRTCAIPLKITVPPAPGETRKAKVTVHANGNQRFSFTVTAAVRGQRRTSKVVLPAANPQPVVTATALDEPTVNPDIAFTPDASRSRFQHARPAFWRHAVPAALLVALLLGIVLRDYFSANAADDIDPREKIALRIDWAARPDKGIGNSLMFGLQEKISKHESKPLLRDPLGQSNSVVLLIDGKTRVLGRDGKLDGPMVTYKDKSRILTWTFTEEGISLIQHLQLIPGDPIEVSEGVFKRYYDTCLVHYTITNNDAKPHNVSFRIMLDTYIGEKDSPLFAIPGRAGIVRSVTDLHGKDIPDYIQAREHSDLVVPGTIAQLNLRLGDRLEFPSRVSLTEYPGWNEKFFYEVPVRPDGKTIRAGERLDDSVIVLYWKSELMPPGKSRDLGFTYGVDYVGGRPELTILNPGPVVQGSDFSIVALVADVQKGAEASIKIPDGLTLAPGSQSRVMLAPAAKDEAGNVQPSPATWTLHAAKEGRYKISVTTGAITAERVVTIRKSSVF
ncbi:MAG: hypothetical protein WCL32_20425 [Planctomycetota bacterium]